jgi:hypothetical protein
MPGICTDVRASCGDQCPERPDPPAGRNRFRIAAVGHSAILGAHPAYAPNMAATLTRCCGVSPTDVSGVISRVPWSAFLEFHQVCKPVVDQVFECVSRHAPGRLCHRRAPIGKICPDLVRREFSSKLPACWRGHQGDAALSAVHVFDQAASNERPDHRVVAVVPRSILVSRHRILNTSRIDPVLRTEVEPRVVAQVVENDGSESWIPDQEVELCEFGQTVELPVVLRFGSHRRDEKQYPSLNPVLACGTPAVLVVGEADPRFPDTVVLPAGVDGPGDLLTLVGEADP